MFLEAIYYFQNSDSLLFFIKINYFQLIMYIVYLHYKYSQFVYELFFKLFEICLNVKIK